MIYYIAIASIITAILVVIMASLYVQYLRDRIYELEDMNRSLSEFFND